MELIENGCRALFTCATCVVVDDGNLLEQLSNSTFRAEVPASGIAAMVMIASSRAPAVQTPPRAGSNSVRSPAQQYSHPDAGRHRNRFHRSALRWQQARHRFALERLSVPCH